MVAAYRESGGPPDLAVLVWPAFGDPDVGFCNRKETPTDRASKSYKHMLLFPLCPCVHYISMGMCLPVWTRRRLDVTSSWGPSMIVWGRLAPIKWTRFLFWRPAVEIALGWMAASSTARMRSHPGLGFEGTNRRTSPSPEHAPQTCLPCTIFFLPGTKLMYLHE